jgi:hypothetical protein
MTSCDPDTVTYLNLKLSSTRSPLFRRSLRTLHAQTSLLRREGSKNVRGTRPLVNYKSNFLYLRFVETREFPLQPRDSLGFIVVWGGKVPLFLSRTKQKSRSRMFPSDSGPFVFFGCQECLRLDKGEFTSHHHLIQVRPLQHPQDRGRQVQRR